MALLLEFTILSMQIATMLYDFIRTRDITIVFKITYTSLIIVQMFLLAWSANEIKEQSSEISSAVYESDWYNMDKRVKKCLTIIMMRAQRPLTLSVGPFFTLTNDTAITVCIN
ncbi:unnamed protein product [Callosobruchus maculatus]|uniref:Odorant receptor n=1 Tax=Callosobruchus maculatus TaxID=64391 RepID=A0A653CVA0_CALMS|nr:unnamed protein product [Callosobruchus maculatus]